MSSLSGNPPVSTPDGEVAAGAGGHRVPRRVADDGRASALDAPEGSVEQVGGRLAAVDVVAGHDGIGERRVGHVVQGAGGVAPAAGRRDHDR